ncbi:DoxX family protein [Candidatus Parcubacteria bacterium]|nr:DoxX family protein [Candidatus Parcubacteria bacterium]
MINNYSRFAPLVLRVTLGIVMLWFGTHELLDPLVWTSYIPTWITGIGISAETFVYINGTAEIILGSLLILGIYTRIVATLLFLHMLAIIGEVGINEIGMRDVGLAGALLSLTLSSISPSQP